jgi:glycosyltransferase involved in cell wall biosynthesis
MIVSVVIPVFNGEKTLPELFERLELSLKGIANLEIIFIHDGGSDRSWDAICNLKVNNRASVKAIRLPKNFGQHYATMCGIEKAAGDFIITMDEDLQHSPEDITGLIRIAQLNNLDLVYGAYIERRHSIFRNNMSKILNKVLRYYIPGLHKDYTSFRLMKADLAKKIIGTPGSCFFIDGALSEKTVKISSTPVSHSRSKIGKSSYTTKKLIWHITKIIIAFSHSLLKVIGVVSCAFFLVSICLGLFIIKKRYFSLMGIRDELLILFVAILLAAFILLGVWTIGKYLQAVQFKTISEHKKLIETK